MYTAWRWGHAGTLAVLACGAGRLVLVGSGGLPAGLATRWFVPVSGPLAWAGGWPGWPAE